MTTPSSTTWRIIGSATFALLTLFIFFLAPRVSNSLKYESRLTRFLISSPSPFPLKISRKTLRLVGFWSIFVRIWTSDSSSFCEIVALFEEGKDGTGISSSSWKNQTGFEYWFHYRLFVENGKHRRSEASAACGREGSGEWRSWFR